MKKTIAFAFVTLVMVGCATTYNSNGIMGGYEDTYLGNGQASVSFQGNGYISTQDAWLFCLTRSAEIAISEGYKGFYIIQSGDISEFSQYTTQGSSVTNGTINGTYRDYGNYGTVNGTYNATTTYSPPQTYNIKKPGFMAVVEFVNEPIEGKAKPFDAQIVLNNGFSRNKEIVKWNWIKSGIIVGGTILIAVANSNY